MAARASGTRLSSAAIGLSGPLALMGGVLLARFAPLGLPVAELLRSAAVGVLVTTVLYVLASLTTRRRSVATYLTTGAVLFAFVEPSSVLLGVGLAAAACSIFIAASRLKTRSWLPHAETAMRGLSHAFLVAGIVTMVANGSLDSFPDTFDDEDDGVADGPPIYLILLDGYPRADLLESLGYDNSAFLAGLESMGIENIDKSTSNYIVTQLSLASMLEMRHVDDIAALENVAPDATTRVLSQVIANGGSALDHLRTAGYAVATVPSIMLDVEVRNAHRLGPKHLSHFEIYMIMTTAAGRALELALPDLLADNHRSSVTDALDTLVAEQRAGRFILAHVMSPHPPYVFGPNGEPRPLPTCAGTCEYWARDDDFRVSDLFDQLDHLNDLVLRAIDEIDRDAIVVVMSDHGIGLTPKGDFHNFLAARTPGAADVFPKDMSLITMMPRLLNAYLGTELPVPADRYFALGPGGKLDLVESSP